MDAKRIEALLAQVQSGALSPAAALETLRHLPIEDVGDAVLDHHRSLRAGVPEVVLGEWKTAPQIARLLEALADKAGRALATRVSADKAEYILDQVDGAAYHELARAVIVSRGPASAESTSPAPATGPGGAVAAGTVAVVCAGTSDLPVSEEAAVTLEFLGHRVERVRDVGVAGLHRLFGHLDTMRGADALIVVAGMEGALPSVVAGLVDRPLIAVPTSVGYGVSQGGFAALMGMLSSCSAGVLVVNIDNGFGAAVGAARICRTRQRSEA
ncbi:nickel pincer cofactor biosynthesis protein LarB [Haliangium ochraceum]|uniref:1-(5-phosphoribosyl)-5-amino-4-imidazole-carboxylate (AIR) carboxylase n=1 Tax=Haliangium ochraceum (strain DSM 14365 / JCM 11303 / SMP-2) TaxID=502025 RepID=D0LKP7_HALO1|nr:nickel pincer cofactor biosynthesis protein LarB [Haliangium ochraceum]ACY15095.1 1-(5-phosphoribosyl)-5-amino-4-imidazole- carboxylate (AIR) carboxylase [Haliangium ochraceum DSM 14365]